MARRTTFANLADGLHPFSLFDDALNRLFFSPTYVTVGAYTISPTTDTAIIIKRTAPSTTTIALPSIAAWGDAPLVIKDKSTGVTAHDITLTPSGTNTIDGETSWIVASNSVSRGGVVLYPSTDAATGIADWAVL